MSYFRFATFHPTFAYEALWNLGLVGVLLAVDRNRGSDRPLSPVVVAFGYALFALGGGLDVLLVVQRQTSLGTPAQVALFLVGAVAMAGAFRIASGLGTDGLRRRADLFVLYIAGYFLGRLWVESLRIDTANTIAGLRLNEWTAIVVGVAALLVLAWRGRVSEPRPIMAASGSVVGPPWDADAVERDSDDEAVVGEVADEGGSPTDS